VVCRRLVALARRLGKPIVVHTREAAADTLAILEEEGAREVGGIIHCFSEDRPFAESALALDFDLSFSARVADKYNFRVGANNILDKQPPIVGGEVANAPFGNGNTFPQVYDALGRFLFAWVTIDF